MATAQIPAIKTTTAAAVPATEERKVSKTLKTIGGMTGGFVEACALQPLDTVKTRLQLSGTKDGAITIGRKIVAEEGVAALYKGLTPFIAHLVIKYALRFSTNEFYRGLLADKDGKVSKFNGFLAGAGAGITEAVMIVTPFEVVKTRLQQQKGLTNLKYKGPVHAAQTIFKEEGAAALWKGCVPTMTRQGLNQCFLFGSYDMLKSAMWGLSRDDKISSTQALVTGMVAGMLGPCFNTPVDVAKTRLMAQANKVGEAAKYNGMVHCIKTVYKEEGAGALYRGLIPRMARVAPGQGITFAVMELVCRTFA
ncbi:mitochondrial substrate carrier [Thraustotheca clavata]|uniref:Mitochondrial substrate carrier n=1 Tax=Thraustotheca clavata TaxID=74557 RepID=A0A1V9Z204_9STRA|nr:mitochondrial substrate carrier [Thraustotheca clavata]